MTPYMGTLGKAALKEFAALMEAVFALATLVALEDKPVPPRSVSDMSQ